MASVAEGAARGAVWNVATSVGTRVAGLVGTLLMTRFIAPHDLGEVGAANVVVGTAMLFTHLRYGNYLIAKKGDGAEGFNAHVVHIALGVVASVAVIALRHPLAAFFDSPGSARYVPWFALVWFIERIAYIPQRLLVRSLSFRKLSIARSLGELAYTVLSLGFAPLLGGMAIVVGNIARQVVVTAATLRVATWSEYGKPAKLSWSSIRNMTTYSLPGAVSGICEYAAYRWDNLLMSRYFGPRQHGIYNLAYNLADTPTGAVGDQVADVLFPSFAKLEVERRGPALKRATALMALVIFPLAVGLAAIAPTLVRVIFSPAWAEVAPMLAILSALSVARTLGSPPVAFLQAQHHNRPLAILSVAKVVILIVAIVLTAPLGPLAACYGVGATFILDTLLCLLLVQWLEKISVVSILAGVLPVIVASALMAASVYGARHGGAVLGFGPGWGMLFVELMVGAISYVVFAFVVARSLSNDLLDQLKRIIARRRGRE